MKSVLVPSFPAAAAASILERPGSFSSNFNLCRRVVDLEITC